VTELFRTPDERFEALPGFDGFSPRYADVDGLRMHYVD
jgi:haloalkane dehalogenase